MRPPYAPLPLPDALSLPVCMVLGWSLRATAQLQDGVQETPGRRGGPHRAVLKGRADRALQPAAALRAVQLQVGGQAAGRDTASLGGPRRTAHSADSTGASSVHLR